MERVRKWLILFRAHTAILEAPLAVLGAWLALGSVNEPVLLGWLGFGMLYHYVGYGMNSYADWKKGFDKDDPEKQHHPLNKGTIEPDLAKKAVYASLAALILSGIALGGLNITTLASLLVMVFFGVSYNYFGKVMILKFVPISIVHTMVFVFPYLVYSEQLSAGFVLAASAYFIHHAFQIIISGDVKDIGQDEASLIKELGATVGYGIVYDNEFNAGMRVMLLAFSLVMAQVILATSAAFFFGGGIVTYGLIVILSIWMFYESDKIITNGPVDREGRLEHISKKEIAGYLMVHSSLTPVIGIRGYAVVVVFMLGYLLPISKYMWGNWVKPEV